MSVVGVLISSWFDLHVVDVHGISASEFEFGSSNLELTVKNLSRKLHGSQLGTPIRILNL